MADGARPRTRPAAHLCIVPGRIQLFAFLHLFVSPAAPAATKASAAAAYSAGTEYASSSVSWNEPELTASPMAKGAAQQNAGAQQR
jgi:hypothetical protein